MKLKKIFNQSIHRMSLDSTIGTEPDLGSFLSPKNVKLTILTLIKFK